MSWKTIILGIFLRAWMFKSGFHDLLVDRVEIATPLTSWKRITEGVNLFQNRGSAYEGDLFHGSPLILWIFTQLQKQTFSIIAAFFVAVDIMTAVLLAKCAENFLKSLVKNQENIKLHKESGKMIVSENQRPTLYRSVLAAYLLNPYSVVSCVAMTTTVVNNFVLAVCLLSIAKGWKVVGIVAVTLASYQELYPLCLLVPLAVSSAGKSPKIQNLVKSIAVTVTLFVPILAGLLYASFIYSGDWKFLQSTYGTILTVPDLTPNIGLFWYFFTEMFDHFYSFFTCVFQINAFVYVIPLTLRFDKNVPLLTFTLCALMTIFKSYPSVGDVAFYLSLLPLWKHLLPLTRHSFIVACIILATTILGPIVWHLWIYAGSANANFFFAMTLAFATAQIFLVTDLLFAQVKYEYHLEHGMDLKLNGKPAYLVLE